MRRWGIIITSFYGLVVVTLIVPVVWMISVEFDWGDIFNIYRFWMTWVWVGILVGGQALLLLVSVDSPWKRLKPRQHIWVTVGTIALLIGILTSAAVVSLLAAMYGDELPDAAFDTPFKVLGCWFGLWLLWGIVFFLYIRRMPQRVDKVIGWLLRGSVLELLIAVPCHIIVRHREECSAPVATGFGIATGLAIMILSFGPSVLFLYKKRMKQYEN